MMKNIFRTLLLSVTILFAQQGKSQHMHADGTMHEGHDHGGEEENVEAGPEHFTTEVNSAMYELLLRYEPITPGEDAHLTLFVSDYETNAPISDVKLKMSAQEDASIEFHPERESDGTWHIHAIFPEKKAYSIAVQIEGNRGADLLLLPNVKVGETLNNEDAHDHNHWYTSQWFLMIVSFIGGIVLLLLIQKLTGKRVTRGAAVIAWLLLFIPTKPSVMQAHEGHDHGEQKKTTVFSNSIQVPKESQFLLDVFTQKVTSGDEVMVQNFYGTVVPSSSGQAIITAPQTGRIISLHTSVGSQVSVGQTLAIIEGFVDAAGAMAFQAERNNLQAEYDAARKELDRMKSIADIAAKKDLDEAEARFKKAQDNLELFKNKTATRFELKSPISGVIDNFTLSIGTPVAQSEALFTVVNPSKIYIDAQVYGNATSMMKAAKSFVILDALGNNIEATLLAIPQTLHESNQSQHVLFEVSNPDNVFKIGEYVTVRAMIPTEAGAIVIPSSAITEVDGRACVFVKESAEGYQLRFVNVSNDNGTTVNITKGLQTGERVVTNATYQMKMIYLNQ